MPKLYQPDTPLAPEARYRVVRTAARPATLLPGHDPAWQLAERITWGPDPYRTSFAALWNDAGLAVRFDACDRQPWHTMTRRDDPIWEEEVVEIFLDPLGTGRDYAEIEISPINVVTDLRVIDTTPLRNDRSWNWAGLESTVIPGSCEGLTAGSWAALVWLPWSGLRSLSPEVAAAVPPSPQRNWRFNVFRIKRPGGASAPEEGAIYAAWSAPDGPTFHAPAFFRTLAFAL
jgi:hypothetical protein